MAAEASSAAAAAGGGVVVVGSANYDLFCYMPRFPKPHETIHGHRAAACCGGKGSNQATMSARMGAPTTMVGRLGRDAFGATIRAAWEADGVDMMYVHASAICQSTFGLISGRSPPHFLNVTHPHRHVGEASDGVATGQAQIWVDDAGTNSIVIVAGANAELSPEDVQAAESAIAGAAVVVVR